MNKYVIKNSSALHGCLSIFIDKQYLNNLDDEFDNRFPNIWQRIKELNIEYAYYITKIEYPYDYDHYTVYFTMEDEDSVALAILAGFDIVLFNTKNFERVIP